MRPDSKAVFFSLFQEVEVPAAQPISGWWCNTRGQSAECTKIKKSLVRSLLNCCFCMKHIKVCRSFLWSSKRNGLTQTFPASSLLHPQAPWKALQGAKQEQEPKCKIRDEHILWGAFALKMWPQTFFLLDVKFIIKFQTLQLDLMCIFLLEG